MTLFNRNKITKLTAAILLSISGAALSVSAIAMNSDKEQFQEVEIDAEAGKDVKIFVNKDGQTHNLTIDHATLSDKSALRELLSDLPVDVKDKLIDNLVDLSDGLSHENGELGSIIKFAKSAGDERVIVIKNDNDADIEQHIIKEFDDNMQHKVIKIAHHGEAKANAVLHLLKNGKFSADELNKIQQALDEKR